MQNLTAEIVGPFETKSGNAKATGKPYTMTEQPALLNFPSGERKRVMLTLEAPSDAFEVGSVLQPKDTALYVSGFQIVLSTRGKDWQKVKAGATAKAA